MAPRKKQFLRILKEHYRRRYQKNKNYSQNAYARDLGISPARLSQILSEKSGLSAKSALLISQALKLSPVERSVFLDSVVASHSRSRLEQERATIRLRKMSYQR